jgi:hypothetical protein
MDDHVRPESGFSVEEQYVEPTLLLVRHGGISGLPISPRMDDGR